MQTSLVRLTRATLKRIRRNLADALDQPKRRAALIRDAEAHWMILSGELAHEDVPEELKTIGVQLAIILDGQFAKLLDPAELAKEHETSESNLRKLVMILDGMHALIP